MESTEKNKVCSIERAGVLDIRLRKLVHNSKKMLKPFIKEGMSVLDLGCGPGFFTIEMARLVGQTGKVTAVDLQDGMLEIVRKKITNSNLENKIVFHKCQNDKIGLSKTFDFILIFYMLHEVHDQSVFLQEVFSLLKPGGKVLISEPKFHVNENDFDHSKEILRNIGFEIIDVPKVFFSRSVLIKRA